MFKRFSLSALLFSASTLACPLVDHEVAKYKTKRAEEIATACPKYKYERIGAEWGSLCPEYGLCGNGTQQSPIDLPLGQFASTHRPTVSLPEISNGYLVNTGHGPQWAPQTGNEPVPNLLFDGKTYQLLQWHTHKPYSEHAVNGTHTDGEIHFVFTLNGAPSAVIAILLQRGTPSQPSRFLADLFSQLDANNADLPALNSTAEVQVASPFQYLLNADYLTEYWTYDGSFTTPPCTEGIRFFISGVAETMTAEQSQRLGRVSAFNGRELQGIKNQKINV